MKKSILIYIFNSIIMLLIGSMSALFLMTAVWLIPNEAVKNGVDDIISISQKEDTYDHEIRFFTYSYGCKLLPDKETGRAADNPDKNMSAIKKAMFINGYSRYWHGYLVFLRPLLPFLDYGQIRYLMAMIFVILIGLIMIKLQERSGKMIAFLFFLSLGLINFLVVTFSLHTSIAFFITFISVVYFLYSYNDRRTEMWRWRVYFIFGMCMSFSDFLTTPITGLALPLLMELIIDKYTGNNSDTKKEFLKCISASTAWCLGYGLLWAQKWILGSIILKRNILSDATDEAKYWLSETSNERTDAIWALEKNIFCLFPTGKGIKELTPFLIVLVILLLILVILFVKKHGSWNGTIKKLLPILLVSLYPYIWIAIMHRHSAVHATFWVYRIQLCSIFGLLSFYWMSLDYKNINLPGNSLS